MSKIIGYTAKKNNNFRNSMLVLAGITFVILIWVLFSASHQKPIEPEVKKTTTTSTTSTTLPASTSTMAQTTTTTIKTEHKAEIKVEKNTAGGAVRVEKTAFCRSLTNNYPQETAEEFTVGDTVYFWTGIAADSVPQTIQHVWITPSGATHFAVDLNIRYSPTSTWSRIALEPGSQGEWTVRVVAGGEVVGEKKFRVKP